jgi:hypothetical protein
MKSMRRQAAQMTLAGQRRRQRHKVSMIIVTRFAKS